MNLQSHLSEERGRASALAAKLKVAPAYLYQMAKGDRPVPPDLVPAIEDNTSGKVRRWDLRPGDWHLIWPELIGTDGAPPVPQPEGQGETKQAA